ncbi:MAG: type II toxin-antitoxin system RelE/ParE family toxin [bacterium]|nr:type II toxin-antitoxin system RelE/ParE family toxin [bacterium]
MDKIGKAVKQILEKLSFGKIDGLDIKKLKGREDIFRIRKGNVRIIYQIIENNKIFILAIERRREDTYKL